MFFSGEINFFAISWQGWQFICASVELPNKQMMQKVKTLKSKKWLQINILQNIW